jgi:hypothetical protein
MSWGGRLPGFPGLLAAAAVVPAPAFAAQRTPPVSAPEPSRAESLVGGQFLDEGFEAAFPPAGWTVTGNPAVTGPNRWHQTADPAYVRTGAAAALIRWQSPRTQDEFLAAPAIDLSGAPGGGLRLELWWYGNPFWAANADFSVQASSDNATWAVLWRMSDLAETGWAWRVTVLDLGAWAGGNLWLRFRYKGKDGADLALDDVRVGYLIPPAPPVNDDCAGAAGDPAYVIGTAGAFALSGDNSLAAADYPLSAPGSCTGFSHSGRDVVWIFDVPAQHEVVATMTTIGGWDDTLFLLTDCADPQGSCVAGDNALPDGSTVRWTNTLPQTRRVYLVASAYSQGAGPFALTGAVQPGTAVEASSWGAVKALYR